MQKNYGYMMSGDKISKGGIVGAIAGLLASVFIHKTSDSAGRKVIKSGAFGLMGYFLGTFAEKKIKERK